MFSTAFGFSSVGNTRTKDWILNFDLVVQRLIDKELQHLTAVQNWIRIIISLSLLPSLLKKRINNKYNHLAYFLMVLYQILESSYWCEKSPRKFLAGPGRTGSPCNVCTLKKQLLLLQACEQDRVNGAVPDTEINRVIYHKSLRKQH